MTLQNKLSTDFKARQNWHTNRASAIFPIYIKGEKSDVRIVFLNYFLIKNSITNVVVNYRLYDKEGALIGRHTENVENMHNELSVKSIVEGDSFEGMLEVEFISTENLRFTFPGIVAMYESRGLISSVHSAGRVRNAEEPYGSAISPETNWTCKWGEGVTPFFHLFNGARTRSEPLSVEVEIYSEQNELLRKIVVATEIRKPFSSELVCIDEIVSIDTPGEFFIVVKVPAEDNFPRMVVGNYFREQEFLETTHSFARTEIEDYIAPPDDDRALSVMSLLQFEPLLLEGVVFPTNVEGEVDVKVRRKKAGQEKLGDVDEKLSFETGGSGNVFKYQPARDDEFCALTLFGEKVPSRINCSFRYSLIDVESPYSTDIASGFKSWVYPEKYNHWGYGVISDEFETMVMIRNMSNRVEDVEEALGKLHIFDLEGECANVEVRIPAEGADRVLLSEHAQHLKAPGRASSLSWYLEMNAPHAEVFWVSYALDGRILGDHAF